MKALFACLAVTALLLGGACRDSFLNPKQINFHVLEGEDFEIRISHEKHNLSLNENHVADGFNIKKDDEVEVQCLQGDSVRVFIAGDIRNEGEYYFSAGDTEIFHAD